MNDIPILDNPITWVNIRISSLRNTLIAIGIYVFLIAGLVFMSVESNRSTTGVAESWSYGLLGIQAFVLLFMGTQRISAVIRRDITTQMIESHRLMPLTPAQVISGYLFGACTQPLIFAGANFLLGAAIGSMGSISMARWCFANAVLVYFAFFMWTLVIFCAFVSRHLIVLFSLPLFATMFSRGMALYILPGAILMTMPLVHGSIFSLTDPITEVSPFVVVSAVAEACFGALYFFAAARKYRQPDRPAFTTQQAMGLLLVWVVVSIIGLVKWNEIRIPGVMAFENRSDAQWIASCIVALLLAVSPVSSAARMLADWQKKKALGAGSKRPISPEVVCVVTTFICLFLLFATPANSEPLVMVLGETIAVVGFFLFSVHFLLRILYRISVTRGNVLVAAWILITWLCPLILDLIRYCAFQFRGNETTMLGLISPPATLWGIVRDQDHIWLGLALQGAAMLALGGLFYRTQRHKPQVHRV